MFSQSFWSERAEFGDNLIKPMAPNAFRQCLVRNEYGQKLLQLIPAICEKQEGRVAISEGEPSLSKGERRKAKVKEIPYSVTVIGSCAKAAGWPIVHGLC
jgi:hypothetical protein